MSVQSIGSSSSVDLWGVSQASGQSQTQGCAGDDGGGGPAISGPAKFMAKLQELETSDPDKAKQVLTSVAEKLRAEAKDGGANADKLTELADKFQKAADTGDLSGLKPPEHHGGKKGHHGEAHKAYSQSGDSLGKLLEQALSDAGVGLDQTAG